jgi:hypothetical protein
LILNKSGANRWKIKGIMIGAKRGVPIAVVSGKIKKLFSLILTIKEVVEKNIP